jgi:hypothetical protein
LVDIEVMKAGCGRMRMVDAPAASLTTRKRTRTSFLGLQ